MKLSTTIDAIAISVDDVLDTEFEELAGKYGWPYLHSPSRSQVMRRVTTARPRAVVLHVHQSTDHAMQLIRALQNSWQRPAVIVVASSQSNGFEGEARLAGVTCFLADNKSTSRINAYVESIVKTNRHESATKTGTTNIDHLPPPSSHQQA